MRRSSIELFQHGHHEKLLRLGHQGNLALLPETMQNLLLLVRIASVHVSPGYPER